MNTEARKRRVLLIEDDPALGIATCDVLRHLGHDVDWMVSANEAFISLAQANDFNAVLLDLGLDEIDGVSLINALREDGHALPPLLIFSAQPIEVLRSAAKTTGAAAILQKPCSAKDLNAALNRVLQQSSSRRT